MSCAAPEKPVLFIFDSSPEGKILVDENLRLPWLEEMETFRGVIEISGGVSRRAGCDVWAVAKQNVLPDSRSCVHRRELPAACGTERFRRSGVAFQVMNLYVKNKFCGACGGAMTNHEIDLARYCPICGNTVYPALSSAVIVAVERDDRLLMGHNANFPANRYSVLAGFVEPGETLEDAIAREIYEESRVIVKNIRYFGSQPWPFPNSMMFGFQADWESGEPSPGDGELTDVKWFNREELPSLPPSHSIARRLIEDWLKRGTC
jgi:NAD+ diphosphatase